jgi:hypothetical protein
VPERIRTSDLWIRSPTLYPAELQARPTEERGSFYTPKLLERQAGARPRCGLTIPFHRRHIEEGRIMTGILRTGDFLKDGARGEPLRCLARLQGKIAES